MNKFVILLNAVLLLSLSTLTQAADWREIKTRLSPGIVHIHVAHEVREQSKPYRQGNLEFRMGTGFFLDDGIIVTNQHVIEGAQTISIEGVATKEKFRVELAAIPSLKFDLAVLKFVDDEELKRFIRINGAIQPLEWAQWEEAQPGQAVSVLGFGNSNQLVATQGIISNWEPRYDALQRRLDHVTLIRTDAAVNPGNSGGPVVSSSGRIIGISARYGAGENIGLLIPFATARQVVETLITKGKFIKTETGLVTYNINPELREILGLSVDQTGVVVSHVVADSSADKAGIRQWDVLASVNGYQINHGEIQHPQAGNIPYWFLYNAAAPDTEVEFQILRAGTSVDTTLKLAASERSRTWLPIEGDDYEPEWGYLGGLVITEVTRGLLTEIENNGNWRWDLVNDSSPANKIYIVSNIEAGTQAMSYQEYGLDMLQSRVYSINGKSLNGNLSERLAELHDSISRGTAAQSIVVGLENNISIKLNAENLHVDMMALVDRYPAVAKTMTGDQRYQMAGMYGSRGLDGYQVNSKINWNGGSYHKPEDHGAQQHMTNDSPANHSESIVTDQ